MKTSGRIARSELAIKTEINKCVLCHDAPCKKIYKKIAPKRIDKNLKD